MVRNKIPSVFLFFKMIQKGIPSIVYLPRKGSAQNYEVLNVFLVHKMVRNFSTLVFFRNGSERNYVKFRCFLLTKSFRTEFRTFFIFRGMARNGILSVFRIAKQMEIRRKKPKFPFFSENGTSPPTQYRFSVIHLSLGRRMFLNEKAEMCKTQPEV
jgi:hypothetical protein